MPDIIVVDDVRADDGLGVFADEVGSEAQHLLVAARARVIEVVGALDCGLLQQNDDLASREVDGVRVPQALLRLARRCPVVHTQLHIQPTAGHRLNLPDDLDIAAVLAKGLRILEALVATVRLRRRLVGVLLEHERPRRKCAAVRGRARDTALHHHPTVVERLLLLPILDRVHARVAVADAAHAALDAVDLVVLEVQRARPVGHLLLAHIDRKRQAVPHVEALVGEEGHAGQARGRLRVRA